MLHRQQIDHVPHTNWTTHFSKPVAMLRQSITNLTNRDRATQIPFRIADFQQPIDLNPDPVVSDQIFERVVVWPKQTGVIANRDRSFHITEGVACRQQQLEHHPNRNRELLFTGVVMVLQQQAQHSANRIEFNQFNKGSESREQQISINNTIEKTQQHGTLWIAIIDTTLCTTVVL